MICFKCGKEHDGEGISPSMKGKITLCYECYKKQGKIKKKAKLLRKSKETIKTWKEKGAPLGASLLKPPSESGNSLEIDRLHADIKKSSRIFKIETEIPYKYKHPYKMSRAAIPYYKPTDLGKDLRVINLDNIDKDAKQFPGNGIAVMPDLPDFLNRKKNVHP